MSRTKKGSKGPGYDYTQKRPGNRFCTPGTGAKNKTARLERRRDKDIARKAMKEPADMTKTKLPPLYKKSSTGAIQFWEMTVDGNTMITRWGILDGKIQEASDTIREGKNIGKKNETTPEQQALLEGTALWEKKKKKGYVESVDAAESGKTDALIEGGIFPMLAHRYDKSSAKISFPAFVQPKLDGHRCIVVVENGKASMWSRTRKPILCLPHIIQEFENAIDGNAIFDGELYNHDYKDNFEELTSYIRQQTEPKDGHEAVQYHVYDFPHEAGFAERYAALEEFFAAAAPFEYIKLVRTEVAVDETSLTEFFDGFRDNGYEGLMVRNAQGSYLNKRSYDLQKVKTFDDAEFTVIGVEEGRGKMEGLALFVCQMETGQTFTAKMKGELEELRKFVDDPDLAIGRVVTVQYQGLTSANQVPRFPVVLRFREDL